MALEHKENESENREKELYHELKEKIKNYPDVPEFKTCIFGIDDVIFAQQFIHAYDSYGTIDDRMWRQQLRNNRAKISRNKNIHFADCFLRRVYYFEFH